MSVRMTSLESGKRIYLEFPYNAELVALVKTIPGAKFDGPSKSWHVAKRYSAQAARFAEQAAPILRQQSVDELAERARAAQRRSEAQRVRQAEWDREREERNARYAAERLAKAEEDRAAGRGRIGTLERETPTVGTVLRHGASVVRITGHGKSWRLNDESSSMGWPVGCEGERACYAYYERASEAEIAAFEQRETEAAAEAETNRKRRNAIYAISKSTDAPVVGAVPEGETIYSDDHNALQGYRSWIVLTPDGWLWSLTYDGSDGATWGDYNCGYNTRGVRLPATPELVSAIRDDTVSEGSS